MNKSEVRRSEVRSQKAEGRARDKGKSEIQNQ